MFECGNRAGESAVFSVGPVPAVKIFEYVD
jgi:hypothetical protein